MVEACSFVSVGEKNNNIGKFLTTSWMTGCPPWNSCRHDFGLVFRAPLQLFATNNLAALFNCTSGLRADRVGLWVSRDSRPTRWRTGSNNVKCFPIHRIDFQFDKVLMTPRHLLWNDRLRNDLYCVEWGVKLYSLTHLLCVKNITIILIAIEQQRKQGQNAHCQYSLYSANLLFSILPVCSRSVYWLSASVYISVLLLSISVFMTK